MTEEQSKPTARTWRDSLKVWVWWALGVCVVGAAIARPGVESIQSLALVYTWLMILLSLVAVGGLLGIAYMARNGDEKEQAKALAAIAEMREKQGGNPVLKWMRTLTSIAVIALASMPITAIVYGIMSMLCWFFGKVVLAQPGDDS